MKSYEFEGWVHKTNRQKWGVEVVVRADADEGAVRYPQHLLFFASHKNASRVPEDLDVNDHVKVQFIPILDEGVSERTKRAYAINKMMITNLEVVEKARGSSDTSTQSAEGPEEMPF